MLPQSWKNIRNPPYSSCFHVLRVPKSCFSCKHETHNRLTLISFYHFQNLISNISCLYCTFLSFYTNTIGIYFVHSDERKKRYGAPLNRVHRTFSYMVMSASADMSVPMRFIHPTFVPNFLDAVDMRLILTDTFSWQPLLHVQPAQRS